MDESSEIFPSDLFMSLPSTTCKLVIIGDHKQIQARRDNPPDPKHSDHSLMLQFINCGVPAFQLSVQHRMIPLLFNLQGGQLYDFVVHHMRRDPAHGGPGVLSHPAFWWDCRPGKDKAMPSKSRNTEEAYRVLRLIGLLIDKCHVVGRDITVLSGYNRQVQFIRELTRSDRRAGLYENVKICTIDGFQGEENRIIILTLVRNEYLGFMAENGRRAVALSRAKDCLYIIGDSETYVKSDTWKFVIEKMIKEKYLSISLPLRCPKHTHIRNFRSIRTARNLENFLNDRRGLCYTCGV